MFSEDRKGKPEPKTFREKLAQHAEDSTCAGCHRKMDPLGFALENYDGVGAWRETSEVVDSSGQLPGGEKFAGTEDLRKYLWTQRDEFQRALTSRLLSYALGREIDFYDEAQITRIQAETKKAGNRFSHLIEATVRSYPFQYRRNADPQPEQKTAAAH